MRTTAWRALLLVASVAIGPRDVAAQDAPEVRPSEPIPIDSLSLARAAADTIPVLAPRFHESGAREALARVPGEDLLPKNPRNAALRSFVLPGWGQLYTGHPWRAALFASAEVGFFALGYRKQLEALELQEDLQTAREAFFVTLPDSVAADSAAAVNAFDRSPTAITIRGDLADVEERREDWYAYFALSVIFSAVDAYVAAQLDPLAAGFDASRGRAWAAVRLRPAGWP